jgi:hypothetical protein
VAQRDDVGGGAGDPHGPVAARAEQVRRGRLAARVRHP